MMKFWCVFLAPLYEGYDLQAICSSRESADVVIALAQRTQHTSVDHGPWYELQPGTHWLSMGCAKVQRVSEVTLDQLRGADENDPPEIRKAIVAILSEEATVRPSHGDSRDPHPD